LALSSPTGGDGLEATEFSLAGETGALVGMHHYNIFNSLQMVTARNLLSCMVESNFPSARNCNVLLVLVLHPTLDNTAYDFLVTQPWY
jgi:hypothetical protein